MMKNKVNRTVLLGVLALAAFIISWYAPEHSYTDKISSFAFGMLAAVFIGSLADSIVQYRKTRQQPVN
jgi:hypothetical protein